MLIFIKDMIYLSKYDVEIIYDNDSIYVNENNLDDFKSNIKSYIKSHATYSYLVQPCNIIKVFGINKYYKDKKDIKNAFKNNEISIYSMFYAVDKDYNLNDKYSGIWMNINDISYEECKNKYSCGTKFVYFYLSHKLRIYDSYGTLKPYIDDFDFIVGGGDNKDCKIGDIVKFYDFYGIIRSGIVTVTYSNFNTKFYEIYDEANNKLYYDGSIACGYDIIETTGNDFVKAKDIINNPHKYHGVVYTDKYINYINSL